MLCTLLRIVPKLQAAGVNFQAKVLYLFQIAEDQWRPRTQQRPFAFLTCAPFFRRRAQVQT